MGSREPTRRQREILGWIEEFDILHGMPPTVREIGRAFGIASSSVFKHLKALEKKDFLRRGELGARSLELTGKLTGARRRLGPGVRPTCEDCASVPLVGRIAAGLPILAEENREGEVTVSRRIVRSGRYFALRVEGDSMIESGILPGDVVIARVQPVVEDGEIAVCLVGELVGESRATVKHVYREAGGRVRLQPANRNMRPIIVGAGEVTVQGKVVAVERVL